MFPVYVKFCTNKFQERYRIVEIIAHVMYGVNVTARTYMYTMYIYGASTYCTYFAHRVNTVLA